MDVQGKKSKASEIWIFLLVSCPVDWKSWPEYYTEYMVSYIGMIHVENCSY